MHRKIDIEALCADKGLRITEQRRVIARVLGESEDHPDVETLHERAAAIDPNISIATVYRTVRLFEEAGILERHEFGDGRSRYEAASDAHHDHLIDVETGNVIEFVDEELEAAPEADRREARLPPRRPSHGAVRRRPRPRPLSRRRPHARARRCGSRGLVLLFLACLAAAPRRAKWLFGRSRWPRRFLAARRAGSSARASTVEGAPLRPHTLAHRQSHQLARHPDPRRRDRHAPSCPRPNLGHGADPLARRPEPTRSTSTASDRRRCARTRRWRIAERARARRSRSPCFPKARPGRATQLLPFRSTLLEAVAPPPTDVEVRPVAIDYGDAADEVGWHGETRQGQCAADARPQGHAAGDRAPASDRSTATGDRKALAQAAREAIAAALASSRARRLAYSRPPDDLRFPRPSASNASAAR